MATILENIQDVCLEIGEPVPTSVVDSNDLTVLQLFGFMNRIGRDILRDHDWQALVKTYQFTSIGYTYTATMTTGSNVITMANTSGLTTDFEVSGDGIPPNTIITTVNSNVSVVMSNNATKSQTVTLTFNQAFYPLPSNFGRFIDDTSYTPTNRWSMRVLTPQQWAMIKQGWATGTIPTLYRIIGNKVAIMPTLSTGTIFTFEYIADNYVTDNLGATKEKFTADTDTCIFPDDLMIMGCKKLFTQQKGFDSTIIERDYMKLLSFVKAQDEPAQAINMGRSTDPFYLNVPDGNFG